MTQPTEQQLSLKVAEQEVFICHFTPMEYCCGDADGFGSFEDWFECKHCGHVKQLDE